MKKLIFVLALLVPFSSFADLREQAIDLKKQIFGETFDQYIDRMTQLCSDQYNFETEEVLTSNHLALACLKEKSIELIEFKPIVEFNSDRNLNFQTYKVSNLSTQTQNALAKLRSQMELSSSPSTEAN